MFLFAFPFLCFCGNANVIKPIYEKVLDGHAFLQSKQSTTESNRVFLIRQYAKDYPMNSYYLCKNTNRDGSFYSVFSPYPLEGLSLVQAGSPENTFIFWNDNSKICMCNLSELIPYSGYGNAFCDGFPSHWQAEYFVDLSQYDNWEKHFMPASNECNLGVSSVSLGKAGLTFTATNVAGAQFIFTKTAHGWRVSDEAGEIRQVRTNALDMSVLNFGRDYNRFSTTLALKNPKGDAKKIEASFVIRYGKLKSTANNYCIYQLVEATNNDVALSRPIWGMMVGGGMKCYVSLVKRDNCGGYYLAFTDMFSRLCISAIPEVMPDGGYVADPTVGPLSQPKDDPFMRGGVDHIIDLRQFDNYQRFFKDGGGVASAKQENNVLTLTVTNAAGSKFTFSNQDGQWHAYSFWGEINRVKK